MPVKRFIDLMSLKDHPLRDVCRIREAEFTDSSEFS